jgi:stage II sporulation protein GA (sporulation sigma-E factor processing peptidase)
MVIYLDVVFAINLLIDFLILVFTSFVLREPIRSIRLLLSSFAGALYTLFLFAPELQLLWSMTAKILLSILMIRIAFPWRGPLSVLKELLVFYLVSCALGGIAYAAALFIGSATAMNTGLVLVSKHTLTTNLVLLAIFMAPIVLTLAGKSVWKHVQQSKQLEAGIWSLTIVVGGKELTCSGLLDTGNGLMDPISKQPVTIVNFTSLKPLLPPQLVEQLEKNPTNLMDVMAGVEWGDDWVRRVKMVPYRSVGTKMGMMIAFQPDRVRLQKENTIHDPVKTLIGISMQSMSKHEQFEAILHPQILASSAS